MLRFIKITISVPVKFRIWVIEYAYSRGRWKFLMGKRKKEEEKNDESLNHAMVDDG